MFICKIIFTYKKKHYSVAVLVSLSLSSPGFLYGDFPVLRQVNSPLGHTLFSPKAYCIYHRVPCVFSSIALSVSLFLEDTTFYTIYISILTVKKR